MTHLHSPLFSWHQKNNATFANYDNWQLPVYYTSGAKEEHLHTRSKASIFDFCHMGKLLIKGTGATHVLSQCCTANLLTLKPGRCRYAFLLNAAGGIKDDLIVYRLQEEEYLLIVNAAQKSIDMAALTTYLPYKDVCLEDLSTTMSKIDLQGPLAFDVLQTVLPGSWKRLPFYGCTTTSFAEQPLLVSRTGYTGELGVELYCPTENTLALWELLAQHPDVLPAGLGARNTLRLEVGLPSYGFDLDEHHTPAEAGFGALLTSQSAYIGKEQAHSMREKLIPLRFTDHVCAAPHDTVHSSTGTEVGRVTSSIISPCLHHGIALAYVAADAAQQSEFLVQSAAGSLSAQRTSLPFYTTGTARKTLF